MTGNTTAECPNCEKSFEIHPNRIIGIKSSSLPGGWFISAMDQFENFSHVTCPYCKHNYRSKEARLFGLFKSPYTVVILCVIFVVVVVGGMSIIKWCF